MSADTADAQTSPKPGVKFGDLLSERIEQANEVQRDTAEWLTDWMDHHDLDHELDEIERTALSELQRLTDQHAQLRERLRRLVEAAANNEQQTDEPERQERREGIVALDSRVKAAREHRDEVATETGITMDAIANIRRYRLTNKQAKNYEVGQAAISKWRNGHGGPSPEKWVAIAAYMGLPLGEFYRLLVYSEMPRSIPALQQRLYGVERSLRSEREDNQRLREENLRANRTLAANAERLATLERELQEVADEATRRVSS